MSSLDYLDDATPAQLRARLAAVTGLVADVRAELDAVTDYTARVWRREDADRQYALEYVDDRLLRLLARLDGVTP